MQYGELIAQNRSIQHDKSCPIIGIGILGMLTHTRIVFHSNILFDCKVTLFFRLEQILVDFSCIFQIFVVISVLPTIL